MSLTAVLVLLLAVAGLALLAALVSRIPPMPAGWTGVKPAPKVAPSDVDGPETGTNGPATVDQTRRTAGRQDDTVRINPLCVPLTGHDGQRPNLAASAPEFGWVRARHVELNLKPDPAPQWPTGSWQVLNRDHPGGGS